MTFLEFTQSTESAEYLAKVFLYNYERPAEPKPDERAALAAYWYSVLEQYAEHGVLPSEKSKKRGLSLLMMYMATRRVI